MLQALDSVPVTMHVCGWYTTGGGDRTTTTTFSRPMQRLHIVRPRTTYTENTAAKQKNPAAYISLESLFPLFDLRCPRGMKSIASPRKGGLVYKYKNTPVPTTFRPKWHKTRIYIKTQKKIRPFRSPSRRVMSGDAWSRGDCRAPRKL